MRYATVRGADNERHLNQYIDGTDSSSTVGGRSGW